MTPQPTDPDGLAPARVRDRLCDEFEEAWLHGRPADIAATLAQVPEAEQALLFRELLRIDLQYQARAGRDGLPRNYTERFPRFAAEARAVLEETGPFVSSAPSHPRTTHRFEAGDLIAGRYRIVALLGQGGMGEVYRADDTKLGAAVALKFLPPDHAADPDWVARFEHEVALARGVTHPNVCRVHDIGDAAGLPFIVMQYADGQSLDKLCRMSGRLAPEQVVHYARQLCDGLAAVHAAGLLHRDLKPGNVLIDGEGRLLLADFGLAAVAADLAPEDSGAGTVLYMAPEQLVGEEVTERSDLFSLGLILYELTTGQRAFAGRTREELRRRHLEDPPRPSTLVPVLDPRLDEAIARCLNREPVRRPGSAEQLKQALPELSPKKTAELGGSRNLHPRVALALLAAALLGGLLNAWFAQPTMAFHQVSLPQAPSDLRDTARAVAKRFGYPTKNMFEAGITEWDMDLILGAEGWPRPNAWAAPPLYYWYRSSPRPLVGVSRITPRDPALVEPGMVCVMLGPEGKLLEFHGVPDRLPPEHRPKDEESIQALLESAGLPADPNHYRGGENPSVRRPPVFADRTITLFPTDESKARVDLALCDGRPVYFRVSERFAGDVERPDRAQALSFSQAALRDYADGRLGIVLMFGAFVGAVPVVWRNAQLGRIDWRGAVRVGALHQAFAMTGWLLAMTHSWSYVAEKSGFINQLGAAGVGSLMLFVLYLALEPYMRQRWPERLSSWNRLLTGRLLDPLVGRDILLGVALGTVLALIPKGAAWALGAPLLVAPIFEPFTPGVPAGSMFFLASAALVRAVGGIGFLILLLLVLRREWAAWIALGALATMKCRQTFVTFPPDSWITWVSCGALGALIVLTIVRFGLVAILFAHFTASVLDSMPVTTNPEPWYAGLTVVSAVVLVGLATFGFLAAVGGLRAIPEKL